MKVRRLSDTRGGKERGVKKKVEGMRGKLELYDNFADNRGEGAVIGTLSTSGCSRLGVDVEGVLSIDNGALRIAPLIEAGFERAVISYGPFSNRPGLAFAVYILNGHNTSQSQSLPDTFRERMILWLKGCEIDPKLVRLVRWLQSGRVRRTLRAFRWWKRTAKDSGPVQLINENLAVGWFPVAVITDPRKEGNAFIMHALGPENGELWVGGPKNRTRSLRGVQNLPLYLVSILRAEGAVYYISSIDGAPGMAPYPQLRPLAVERSPFAKELYLGIQQSVLGQIGFRLDTRVKGVRIGHEEGYETWYGGAHAADRLTGDGDINGSKAEAGGRWRVFGGKAERGSTGATGSITGIMAILDTGLPNGLIYAEVVPGKGDQTRIGLIWRFLDERNHWRMELSACVCEIVLVADGDRKILASSEISGFDRKQTCRLQVLDDGSHLMAYVDGEPVSENWIIDKRFEEANGVGILLDDSGQGNGTISSFEAHPRTINLPEAFDMDKPWVRKGVDLVLADDFAGQPGDLEGRLTPVGGQRWTRMIGSGVIETTGDRSARIRGSLQAPCPGRTVYGLDWTNPEFADLEVTITPPGTRKGEKERGMSGFILYQDPDNYITLNVWRTDYYGGSSISTFFKFNGFEDLYDAIWTNVGNRVFYGRPSRIRLCCDGEQYLVLVNDEPVLYRAFRDVYPDIGRLQIRKVGLIANWEFGTDTGSKFEQFKAHV